MSDHQNPKSSTTLQLGATNKSYSSHIKTPNPYPNQNPPDPTNPDPATLRDQWRYAIRQYSRWYSQTWGSAFLVGISFFLLDWIIKGENPLPSFHSHVDPSNSQATNKDEQEEEAL